MARPTYGHRPPMYPCRCHADDYIYGGLRECPRCHHRSYDPVCRACERHQCGYQESPPGGKPACATLSVDGASALSRTNVASERAGLSPGQEVER